MFCSIGTDSTMEVKEEPGVGARIQSPACDSDSDTGDVLESADSDTSEVEDSPESAGNYTSEVEEFPESADNDTSESPSALTGKLPLRTAALTLASSGKMII